MDDDGENDKTVSCIICLSTLRREDAVWSCELCYCIFHLSCIQAWAKDRVNSSNGSLSRDLFPNQLVFWSCPKCRKHYKQSAIPNRYFCYCGKKVDPPLDPWLEPHSCGEVCGRAVRCAHTCLSVCHPGPCPPCSRTVSISCYCGHSPPRMERCGVKGWMCQKVCGRLLSCGLHTCEELCHDDNCSACSEVVLQSCQCGKNIKERPCDSPSWSCDQPCLKPLSCGHHICQKICHDGDCGECLRSLPRVCPCGKTTHNLPCTTDVPTCGDTCGKLLSCGLHHCTRLCHHGDCGQCRQVVTQKCRCSKKSRDVMCCQEVLCDSKCGRLRNCGRHLCKKKCCDGHCPPCEQVCHRPLQCRNHKCQAPCHQGYCYPCIKTVDVTCHCGVTKVTVPCGREKLTVPPVCHVPCTLPSTCHHHEREPHTCHPPPCPPCALICGKKLGCGHTCRAPCHSTPKPKPRPPGLAPWIKVDDSALVADPCPPCMHTVRVACVGGHESEEQVCSEKREYSCGSKCGRLLSCRNHTCQRGCHRIIKPLGTRLAGEDCLECERGCEKPRPPGCFHSCPLACHSGECPLCVVLVKVECHCRTLSLFIKCHEWCEASADEKDKLSCCGGQCVYKLSCGHRCPLTCHSGPCLDHTHCTRKITVRCSCGRVKKESLCSSPVTVSCDDECRRIADKKKQAIEAEAERICQQAEAEKLRAVQEKERMLRPRKRRRKTAVLNDRPVTQSQWSRTRVGVVLVVTLALVMCVLLTLFLV